MERKEGHNEFMQNMQVAVTLGQSPHLGFSVASERQEEIVSSLLRNLKNMNPVLWSYDTMLEWRHGTHGLAMLPKRSAASIIHRDRGPLAGLQQEVRGLSMFVATNGAPVIPSSNNAPCGRALCAMHFAESGALPPPTNLSAGLSPSGS